MKTSAQIEKEVQAIVYGLMLTADRIEQDYRPKTMAIGYGHGLLWMIAIDADENVVGFQTMEEPVSGKPVGGVGGCLDVPASIPDFVEATIRLFKIDPSEALKHSKDSTGFVPEDKPSLRAVLKRMRALGGVGNN